MPGQRTDLLRGKSASGRALLEYVYDGNRNLISLADVAGNIVYDSCDARNRLVAAVQEEPKGTTWIWNGKYLSYWGRI